jgi:hypothetical protein
MKMRPEHVHSFFSMGSLMLWPYLEHENAAFFLSFPIHEAVANALTHSPRLKFAFEVKVRDGYATIVEQSARGFEPTAVRRLFGPLYVLR